MSERIITLNEVPEGQTCIVENLDLSGVMRRRLQDLGMITGTKVVPTRKSPHGGPTAYRMRESVYALREVDTRHIKVTLA